MKTQLSKYLAVLIAFGFAPFAYSEVQVGVDLDRNEDGIQTAAFFDPGAEFMVDFVLELTTQASASAGYSFSVVYDADELELVTVQPVVPPEFNAGFDTFGGVASGFVDDPTVGRAGTIRSISSFASFTSPAPSGPARFVVGTGTFRITDVLADTRPDFQIVLDPANDVIGDADALPLVPGNGLTLLGSSVTAVPEPSMFALIGSVACGGLLARRRRAA